MSCASANRRPWGAQYSPRQRKPVTPSLPFRRPRPVWWTSSIQPHYAEGPQSSTGPHAALKRHRRQNVQPVPTRGQWIAGNLYSLLTVAGRGERLDGERNYFVLGLG